MEYFSLPPVQRCAVVLATTSAVPNLVTAEVGDHFSSTIRRPLCPPPSSLFSSNDDDDDDDDDDYSEAVSSPTWSDQSLSSGASTILLDKEESILNWHNGPIDSLARHSYHHSARIFPPKSFRLRQQRSVPIFNIRGGGGIGGNQGTVDTDDDDDDNDSNQEKERETDHFKIPQHHDYFVLRHGQSLANVAGLIASNPEIAGSHYGLSQVGIQQAQLAGQHVIQTFWQTNRNQTKINDNKKMCYKGIVIVSSDLLRANETAQQIFQAVQEHNQECIRNNGNHDTIIPIYNNSALFVPWLRERWFGKWDGTSDSNYVQVWEEDLRIGALANSNSPNDKTSTNNNNNNNNNGGVESVYSVRDRVLNGLLQLEERLQHEEKTPSSAGEMQNNATKPTQQQQEEQQQRYMVICVAHGDVLQILQTAFHPTYLPPYRHRSLPHLETATLRSLQPPPSSER